MADDYINKNGLLYDAETDELVSLDEDIRTTVEEISIPQEQKELPSYLFSGCEALKKVSLPDDMKTFPEGLFQGCTSLEDIPFRAGLEEIPANAFEGCASLKSIVFPPNINAIRSRACADCTSLETVVLPAKMYSLAEDAFDGCENLHNIRIDASNNLFYVNEEDGCLYEKNIDIGDDFCRIKAVPVENEEVGFYKENVDDETDEFFTNEETEEEDDTFSPEIKDEQKVGEQEMGENNVDDMLADIMGEEKKRNEAVSDIGVSDKESAVLSEMMDVMSDSKANKGASVSDDELANLFAEPKVEEKTEPKEVNIEELDSKTQILVDSVANSKVIICEPAGEPPADFDLFVISEKEEFSDKLIACAQKIARIQDLRRIIMISGLPLDNDEFMQFYFHFINKRNVLLGCLAEGPAALSDYCKTLCEQSRINLDKESIIEQRKRINVKNNNLIKLIVRDVE